MNKNMMIASAGIALGLAAIGAAWVGIGISFAAEKLKKRKK